MKVRFFKKAINKDGYVLLYLPIQTKHVALRNSSLSPRHIVLCLWCHILCLGHVVPMVVLYQPLAFVRALNLNLLRPTW